MTGKGDAYLKQYEIAVNATQQVSSWRQNANNFYLTANTILFSLDSYLVLVNISGWFIISLLGVIISVLWLQTITYYRNLNSVKFKAIHKMEKRLPIALYTDEWEDMKAKQNLTTTSIEKWVPILFLVAYLLIFADYVLTIFG